MKTDTQLQQDVIAELNWEPSIDAGEIGVEVKDGIVTLAGHVGTFAEKWDAERAAQRVSGVKALAVEIEVKLFGERARTDADIARAVENVLDWTTFYPKKSIKVMVENGWLTLTGTVDWEYQRRAIANAVRYLMGVKGISDQITIKPALSSRIVKADIEAALARNGKHNGSISVAVQGNQVTLSGTVHNWSAREIATHSAWGTPGVCSVIDDISVVW